VAAPFSGGKTKRPIPCLLQAAIPFPSERRPVLYPGPGLSPARAIASAGPAAAFTIPLGAARLVRRWGEPILAHAVIPYAGKEQDLCAAVARTRTTMKFRGPEADEVVHSGPQLWDSIVSIAHTFEE
jgi:hypothetical protein